MTMEAFMFSVGVVGLSCLCIGYAFGRIMSSGENERKENRKNDKLDLSKWEDAHSEYVNEVRKLWDGIPKTAICAICGKRDFKENLADVEWMKIPGDSKTEFGADGGTYTLYEWPPPSAKYAHPSCAGIKRSDDGKGWVRVKKGAKT